MKLEKILIVCIIFLIGFFSANAVSYLSYDVELPFLNDFSIFKNGSVSPSDFISENQIKVYDDRVVIYVDDASLSRYAPTGSMIPVFDIGANGIRVKVDSEDDVEVGDIVSFYKDNQLIVHRVIEKGVDEKGVYFVTKGDNSPVSDGKIRIKDIRYKTIGVVW